MVDLARYHAKRDFSRTREPKGDPAAKPGGASFVIQKHAARRLHYDLRLEHEGILKSWAVTRGPSLVPGEKRLAVEVEDHPLDYGRFEGTIPKGEYGGGTVMVWDRGTWQPEGDPAYGFAKGHLEFTLHGDKLGGRWHLVRIRGRRGEKRTNWLLIKSDDDFARQPEDPDILEEAPLSAATGRDLDAIAAGEDVEEAAEAPAEKPAKAKPKRRKAAAAPAQAPEVPKSRAGKLPDFVEPALATLQAHAPAGGTWLHEIKFDGYRLQARVEAGRVKLLTRSGLDWTDRFGAAVPAALAALPAGAALIDGELVVEGGNGASDFSALQADLSAGRSDRFVYYAFDLLHLDGRDLTGSGLADRKAALEKILAGAGPAGPLRFSAHFDEPGDMLLRHACRLGIEGIISKRVDRPYRSGRGKDWIKTKCSARQEFVVAGYVPSSVSDAAIGSLVLGYHEDGRLKHAGRVGTGFTAAVAADLHRRLHAIRAKASPFGEKLSADEARGVVWAAPELVAEVEFRGWTGAHHLRHAAFRGLREDKAAAEVVREGSASDKTSSTTPAAPRSAVKLTHPDRVYWPDAGVTKEGLAEYYAEAWRLMAAHVVGRPLSLVRCPDGATAACFFQKHAWRGMNGAIKRAADPGQGSGGEVLWIDDFDGLVALVQAGCLEIHPWGAPLADLERPDRIVMDLDPDDAVAWPTMIEAAHEVRDRLQAEGLAAFLKTTGGKGLHVVAPLAPRAGWEEVKAFTRRIAEAMAADAPDRFVATAAKAKRKGRIFVDWLRNGRGATAVAPYSTRSRPGAPVSAPLAWDELTPAVGSAHFTVLNLPQRLAALEADPWADFLAAAAPLPVAAKPGRGSGTRRR